MSRLMNRPVNRPVSRWILLLAAVVSIPVSAAQAHHSIAGVYDTGTVVTIDGAITEFAFVNPHPYVMVEGRLDGGESQKWKLEMDNLSELVDAGMNKESLKAGDRVVVKGNPIKNKGPVLYIRKLERSADGFVYEQVGRSPRISGGR